MTTVQLTTEGIRKHLGATTPEQAIAEYIWNGLDARAKNITVDQVLNEAGGIEEITIHDDGDGICHKEHESKFGVFLDSEKIKLRKSQKRTSSDNHGKDGIGRLTFFVFANNAEWTTVYELAGKRYRFKISVSAENLISYPITEHQQVDDNTPKGTTVKFTNINSSLIDLSSAKLRNYLICEYCWKLILNDNMRIQLCNEQLMPGDNIAEVIEYCPILKESPPALVKIVRWKEKLHKEYSRYYFLNSTKEEKYTDFTSLNKKGDSFFHSVYVESKFFDDFSIDKSIEAQADLNLGGGTTKSDWFKAVVLSTDRFMRDVRKDFLKKSTDDLITKFEQKGILPTYNEKNIWEIAKHDNLAATIGELYNLQPSLFSSGSTEQKKIFVRLIDQLLDANEAESLYQIIAQVLDLDTEEKSELLGILKSSKLGSIIKATKLIQDRYRALEQIKRLNWDPDLKAKEVPHIQAFMESHYWMIGEEYSLVVAAEKDFEQALRELYRKIDKPLAGENIEHKDKQKELDVFLVRQDRHHGKIHNVVLELKHPKKPLGRKFAQQIQNYFEVIASDPRFNAANMEWSYYLIGNKFDETGHIENLLENAKPHGESSLIYKVRNHKIYVKLWSELFAEIEMRHQFLNDRLQIQRDLIAVDEGVAKTADEVIKRAQVLSCSTK